VIKRVSLVRRLPGMTHEEFVAHWSGPHVEIVRNLPGLRGLRLNVVEEWTPGGGGWDGIGELWFDSIDVARAAFQAEPYAGQLVDDRARFLAEVQVAFVEERTLIPPPR
jgi:uncharacterized protein (TIGR02118 family)